MQNVHAILKIVKKTTVDHRRDKRNIYLNIKWSLTNCKSECVCSIITEREQVEIWLTISIDKYWDKVAFITDWDGSQ